MTTSDIDRAHTNAWHTLMTLGQRPIRWSPMDNLDFMYGTHDQYATVRYAKIMMSWVTLANRNVYRLRNS